MLYYNKKSIQFFLTLVVGRKKRLNLGSLTLYESTETFFSLSMRDVAKNGARLPSSTTTRLCIFFFDDDSV